MESLIHLQGSLTSSLTPLFLVHAVSGLALPYFALPNLSSHLPESQARPVYGISSPIYDDDLPEPYRLPKSIREIAIQYIELIQENIQPEGPYLLGGWSMGGMIALKMAEILRQRGEEVMHVIMVDSGNPRWYPDFLGEWERDMVVKGTYNAVTGRLGGRRMPLTSGGDESPISSEDDMDYFVNDADADTPASSDTEGDDDGEEDGATAFMLKQMFKHVSNASMTSSTPAPMTDAYQGPVTLLKCTMLGKVNPKLSQERKQFIHKLIADERMGWSKEELPNLRLQKVNCTHDACFDPLNAVEIGERIKKVLRTVY
ncbi:Alpha/Beta hydrolase protein [Kalaharituber pfeilii]|nr:Alpha/Beta hydrolase protein [Kalaharituber pfeilii]